MGVTPNRWIRGLWTAIARSPGQLMRTVHRSDARCAADREEPEPADLAPPTLAWQLWHRCWWLSMVIDHSFGSGRLTRETVEWAGPEAGFDAVELLGRWRDHGERLDRVQWDEGDLVRRPYTDPRPFALLAGWVSMELTKNVAEMAQARSFYRTTSISEPSKAWWSRCLFRRTSS